MSKRPWPSLLLCLTLFVAAGSFESLSQAAGVANGYLVQSAKEGRNAALAQAAGEFRIVAANLLWDKVVDHYHHQFMADGGDWAKNESLLPLLQTIIDLDPHFVQAYEVMGGAILPRTGQTARGEAILKQGIERNPNEWELYREMAMLLAWTERKPGQALPYAREGLTQANDEFSRHLMTRLCHTLEDQVRGSGSKSASAIRRDRDLRQRRLREFPHQGQV